MNHDTNIERRRRIADALADAHFKVMACQERAARSAEQLSEAHTAMAHSLNSLNEAKAALERIKALSWTQTDSDDR